MKYRGESPYPSKSELAEIFDDAKKTIKIITGLKAVKALSKQRDKKK